MKDIQSCESNDNKYLKDTLLSFANYLIDSMRDISRMERDFFNLSNYFKQQLVFSYEERIEKHKNSTLINYEFIKKILKNHIHLISTEASFIENTLFLKPTITDPKNITKVRSSLKLIVRDWAKEGEKERKECHFKMIDELLKHYNPYKLDTDKGKKEEFKVLVPGCGLGRLVFELGRKGFIAEGNEFSYHMLILSEYILNSLLKKDQEIIRPYIHTFSNNLNENNPFRDISFPDIDLSEFNESLTDLDISIVAGEFVETYKVKSMMTYHSVLTQFFIDTAHNIIDYIETIHSILIPNGIWINYGPLLYHYTDNTNEMSIELSWEEVRLIIIEKYGFEIINEEIVETGYSSDDISMMKTVYKCIFFSARKL